MVSSNFAALLQVLRLSQGMYKPYPSYSSFPPVAAMMAVPPSDNHPQFLGDNHPEHVDDFSVAPVLLQSGSGDCAIPQYQPPDLGDQTFAPFDPAKAAVYRYRQQQSVNLGSWFVHEAWMSPSLFTCAAGKKLSELDIASGWGSPDRARTVLEHHWDTLITASDFDYLASVGINTVRLPIGYWTLGPDYCQGTPFEPVASVYQNSWPRVIRTINMAAYKGIGVLVDLHGAPGSQNGQQHSGISDGQINLFGNDWNINKTMSVLTFLMKELVNVTNVVGIQILNEPQNVDSLADFYSNAISIMRQVSKEAQSFPLYFHDGFDLTRFSAFVANRTDFVVQDHHSYFVFTPDDEYEPASQHTSDVRGSIADSLAEASHQERRNLVIDEFSCALTDQSLAKEQNADQARKDFCVGQLDIYRNNTAGWAFWAYNKEDCDNDPGWCFKSAVGRALPSTFFAYDKCPFTDPANDPALADMATEMGFTGSSDLMLAPSPSSSPSDGSPKLEVGVLPVRRRSRLRSERRSKRASQRFESKQSRDDPESSQLPLDPTQRAISKGYSDGFQTAKIFALYGCSKLGFWGQYINDSIARLGSNVVKPGTEHYYEDWFMEGLHDGENLISSA